MGPEWPQGGRAMAWAVRGLERPVGERDAYPPLPRLLLPWRRSSLGPLEQLHREQVSRDEPEGHPKCPPPLTAQVDPKPRAQDVEGVGVVDEGALSFGFHAPTSGTRPRKASRHPNDELAPGSAGRPDLPLFAATKPEPGEDGDGEGGKQRGEDVFVCPFPLGVVEPPEHH